MPLHALLLAVAVAAAPQRPVQPDDVYRLKTLTALDVSADGKRIAYTVETADREEDTFRQELWLADAEGRDARRLCRIEDACSEEFVVNVPDNVFFADPLKVGDAVLGQWDAKEVHFLDGHAAHAASPQSTPAAAVAST